MGQSHQESLLGQRVFGQIHPKRASSQYLLSGLARCGHCGKALIGMEVKSGKFAYYVCGTLTKKGASLCRARYLKASKLESLVVHKIREHVLTPDNLTALGEDEVRECATDLRDSLERGSLAERKAFIRSFVKEGSIAGDEAKLTYTLPLLPRGLREETESVLAILHRGGR